MDKALIAKFVIVALAIAGISVAGAVASVDFDKLTGAYGIVVGALVIALGIRGGELPKGGGS